jgi:6-phosphogluconolactonase/glucosamine-6-phosphate isomerase/deaminase
MAPVDERFDPTGETSNFAALMDTDFFSKAKSAGARFIDKRVEDRQGRGDLADGFERTLRQWMTMNHCHPEPLPVIASEARQSRTVNSGKIIAILGMGPDGHTAGIFPDADGNVFHDRFEGDRLVAGYRAPEYATCPERVTATLSSLERNIDQAFVFISGEEKCSAWERVLRSDEPMHLLPAGIFHKLRNVEVFTDVGFSKKG